jgi:hypothetical protein
MLECGLWQVTLGKGLDLQIKILPWAAREISCKWVLISPPPVISLPTKRSERAAAISQGQIQGRGLGKAGRGPELVP